MNGSVTVRVPDEPPALTDPGARMLLQLLVDQAEAQLGPDWRERLADHAGVDVPATPE